MNLTPFFETLTLQAASEFSQYRKLQRVMYVFVAYEGPWIFWVYLSHMRGQKAE